MRAKLYLASSWRNPHQPNVIRSLRGAGFGVYDFRHPSPSNKGFHWGEIDPHRKTWSVQQYKRGLHHPLATKGFATDRRALAECDGCVLLLPCGRSAHLEAGVCVGKGQPVWALLTKPQEPELMYRWFANIYASTRDLIAELKATFPEPPPFDSIGPTTSVAH